MDRCVTSSFRLLVVVAAALLGVAPPACAAGEAPPQRIVSFNLCADELLVALADPGQIAGLSPYAADPRASVVAAQAKAFPQLGWQAESTVALGPDLVLVGPYDRSTTRRMLTQLGLRVVIVDVVETVAAARAQMLDFAALIGHPERGQAMAAKLDAARARLAAVARPGGATALVVERGGYAAGPDSLAAALLAEGGLHPPEGVVGGIGGFVPLERLVISRPDLLVLKDAPSKVSDQGALFLTHPVLRALYPPERRLALPSRYALCGGPALIEAMDYLASRLGRLGSPAP